MLFRLFLSYNILRINLLIILHLFTAKQHGKVEDPITELFKHAFVLKVGKHSVAKALELEKLLEELITSGEDADPTVYSALQFLVGLKNFESKEPVKELVNLGFFQKSSLNMNF